jgi:hypothetical protein
MKKKIQNVSSRFRIDNEIWFHLVRKLSFEFVNKHYDEIQELNEDTLKEYSIRNSLFTDLGQLQHSFKDGKDVVVLNLQHVNSTILSLKETRKKLVKPVNI